MAGSNSTGLMNQELGNKSTRDLLNGKIIWGYSGAIPVASGIYSAADAAETGTRVIRFTTAGATAKVAQVMRITPATAGTTGTWSVTVGKDTVIFTDDGIPSVAEVCAGLTNLLNVMAGGAITTPPGVMNTDNNGVFTVTNNTTSVDVTSAVAGVPIEVSSSCTGAGNTLVTTTQTDNAYGIRFEPYSGVSGAILERKSGDTWSGEMLSDAVITHCRIQADDDAGGLSTTLVRMQGQAATANAEFVVSHTDGKTGETISVTLGEIYKDGAV